MSYNIFITSDTHFGHANMCKFLDYSGNRVRPFDNYEECDELMIQNWNKVVRPEDKVYFLGDFSMKRTEADKVIPRLNGKKCLIKGNHDIFKPNWYLKWFYDIRGAYNFESFLMTHIPVHPDSKARFKMNLHGHIHTGCVINSDGQPDVWYRNVCMDANNYELIPFEQIQHEFSVYKQQGKIILPPKLERTFN